MQASKLIAIVALASLASLMAVSQVEAVDAKQLLGLISNLESPTAKFSTDAMSKFEREQQLHAFIKETTPEILSKYHTDAQKVGKQLHDTINHMIYETKQNNFLASISKMAGKSVFMFSKNFDPEIVKAVDLIEAKLVVSRDVPETEVHCLVQNFLLKHLTNIILILRTNIKYLITEDTALINNAIIQHLSANRFEAKTDFYQGHKFNEPEILLKFYSENQDVNNQNVGNAIDHIQLAGEQIVGKVLENCAAVLQYQDSRQNIASSTENCHFDASTVFGGKALDADAIDETFKLCNDLMASQGE